jgi:hypothetical protein
MSQPASNGVWWCLDHCGVIFLPILVKPPVWCWASYCIALGRFPSDHHRIPTTPCRDRPQHTGAHLAWVGSDDCNHGASRGALFTCVPLAIWTDVFLLCPSLITVLLPGHWPPSLSFHLSHKNLQMLMMLLVTLSEALRKETCLDITLSLTWLQSPSLMFPSSDRSLKIW